MPSFSFNNSQYRFNLFSAAPLPNTASVGSLGGSEEGCFVRCEIDGWRRRWQEALSRRYYEPCYRPNITKPYDYSRHRCYLRAYYPLHVYAAQMAGDAIGTACSGCSHSI